jgi:hypothetical protein
MSVVEEEKAKTFRLNIEVNGLKKHLTFYVFFVDKTDFASYDLDGIIEIDIMSIYDNKIHRNILISLTFFLHDCPTSIRCINTMYAIAFFSTSQYILLTTAGRT